MKTTYRSILSVVALAIFTVSTAVMRGEDYLYETNNGTITITGYTGSGGDVIVPDKIIGLPVTSVGMRAFAWNTNVTAIEIPSTVKAICLGPFGAFNDCSALTEIAVDTANPWFCSVEGVLFDKAKSTLLQCPGGKAGVYTIPNGVATIGPGAFYSCSELTGLIIPASVTRIGDSAFVYCSNLINISVPDGVTAIASAVFMECKRLSSITLGKSLTKIEGEAFFGTGLMSITIPENVRSIGNWAFASCPDLKWAYFRGNCPFLDGGDVFTGASATMYYLPGTMDWGPTLGGRPTALWMLPYPVILTTAPNFGVQTNTFGFRISWATNLSVVVEASTSAANSTWLPVSTNKLISGWSDFSDAGWRNYPARFYRVRSL